MKSHLISPIIAFFGLSHKCLPDGHRPIEHANFRMSVVLSKRGEDVSRLDATGLPFRADCLHRGVCVFTVSYGLREHTTKIRAFRIRAKSLIDTRQHNVNTERICNMKSRKRALESIRSTVFGALFLGIVLAVLSSGQAGAVSDDEDRLFRFASHDKDNGTVRQLLAEGVSPNVPAAFDGRTAVHSAAKDGAAKNLAAMLQAGGNPNVQDRDGNTPLHLASRGSYAGGFSDHPAAVRVLLQHGADLHRTNNSGETPLHVAVFTGVGAAHVGVIKALLDAGARPSAVDGNGLTALQRFTRHSENNGAIVRLLLQAGADPDQKDPRGDAPLHAAIKSDGSYGKAEVVEALLDGEANPCVRDEGVYPLRDVL